MHSESTPSLQSRKTAQTQTWTTMPQTPRTLMHLLQVLALMVNSSAQCARIAVRILMPVSEHTLACHYGQAGSLLDTACVGLVARLNWLLKSGAAGGEGDDGFEKIKSRGEKKRDKLLTMDPKEITYEMVNRKLREISLARGKKGVDRQEQVHTSAWL